MRSLPLVWTAVIATALASVLGIAASGFTARLSAPTVVSVLVLLAAAWYYRGEPSFALCLGSLLAVVLFSTGFVALTYLGARPARPLVDGSLEAWDAALGFHVPDLVAWVRHSPWDRPLQLAYNSMLPQTAAVIALLGFAGDKERLNLFLLRMILGGMICLAFFLALPAEGPFQVYGLSPSSSQVNYLNHLHALRTGAMTHLDYCDLEGLITFPSFHTVWAILLAIACLDRPVIRVFSIVLNGAVILATLTTGWHYLSDVLAAILVTILVCLMTRQSGAALAGRETCPSGDRGP